MAPKKDTPAQRDECVKYAIDLLWQNVDQHLKDKMFFPHIVSHAVARTVAGMVHMVSVGFVNRMESWNDAIVQNRVCEEWEVPKEPVLPPLDTWARGVVPVKKKPPTPPPVPTVSPTSSERLSQEEQQEPDRTLLSPTSTLASAKSKSFTKHSTVPVPKPAPPPPKPVPATRRRATITLSPVPPVEKPSYDRKGSPLRRFSEGAVIPPEMVTKFQAPQTRKGSKKSIIERKSLMLNNVRSSKLGEPSTPTPKGAASKRASRGI